MSAVALKRPAQSRLLFNNSDCLRSLTREELERLAEKTIDRMDDMDPDPDFEGQWDEDAASLYDEALPDGAGCSISDPDFAVDDKPCDIESEDGT
ncbi:MAG: hypothetical protein AAGI28_03560 [Pseudomonadota bacterium]